MSTLHLLSKSPFTDTSLSSCLALLNPEDGILLCGDAVYASQTPDWLSEFERLGQSIKIYALEEDLISRGLSSSSYISSVDYPTFVQLTLQYSKVNSWL